VARHGRPLVGFSMQLVDRLGRCRPSATAAAARPTTFATRAPWRIALGFPHYVLDMEDDFRGQVLDPFAADYAQGTTRLALRALQHLHQVRGAVASAPRPSARRRS
jgi:tRNA U34 2-thiouridine synthase MnmA/TrmU